jgi:hypothetical protein
MWRRGIACQVKSHRQRCEENGDQLDGYVDFDVHIDVYVAAIIQHKAFTRRRLWGNLPTTMVLQAKACEPVTYWRERLDGRNRCLSSPATFLP